MKRRVGIIGCGNMGSAIAEGIKAQYKVILFDKEVAKSKAIKGVEVVKDIKVLLEKCKIVILAVKPQDFDSILQEIKNGTKGKLIISIAAGIQTGYIEKMLEKTRVVRVMPNLPVKVGEGMSGITKGKSATPEDLNFTKKLFSKLGETLVVKEDMMPAVTAISGSGPGFLCDLVEDYPMRRIGNFVKETFIPYLASTASTMGFTTLEAKILAEKTGSGTLKFIKAGQLTPKQIKERVTSKKGTTEAGLRVLKHNINNLNAAVRAAIKRAKELSRG